jgi:uncharacterized protein (TIGR02001 family)
MARRMEAGTLKLTILSAALVGGLALPAQAAELELGGTATFTTDYVFRGLSQTGGEPAVQASLDATYGIFYAGMWGSNVNFADSLEIDYYVGITPEWQGISFDIAGLEYTYPGDNSALDYFELKTGASYTFFEALTLGVTNYWSPDFADDGSDALEFGGEYAFSGKLFNFFSPSVSGLLGWQWYDNAGPDYTYWNVGLTLGFLDNWSADVRYWDTDVSSTGCGNLGYASNDCDARVVGTISASF